MIKQGFDSVHLCSNSETALKPNNLSYKWKMGKEKREEIRHQYNMIHGNVFGF